MSSARGRHCLHATALAAVGPLYLSLRLSSEMPIIDGLRTRTFGQARCSRRATGDRQAARSSPLHPERTSRQLLHRAQLCPEDKELRALAASGLHSAASRLGVSVPPTPGMAARREGAEAGGLIGLNQEARPNARPCCRQVARTVKSRSAKRLPAGLWVRSSLSATGPLAARPAPPRCWSARRRSGRSSRAPARAAAAGAAPAALGCSLVAPAKQGAQLQPATDCRLLACQHHPADRPSQQQVPHREDLLLDH